MPATIAPAVAEGLELYVAALTEVKRAAYTEQLVAILDPGVTTTTGAKYVKVLSTERGEPRGIEAYVDPQTGDVYKPDGMTRPARGIRGNIADPEQRAALLKRLDASGGYLYARR